MRSPVKIILLLTGATLLVSFLFIVYYGDIREYYNQNELVLSVEKPLDEKEVTIVWFSEFEKPDTIFLKGIDLKKTYKEYGKNNFKVYYGEKFIGNYGHLKTCNWDGYKYSVNIKSINDSVFVDAKIVWIKKQNWY